MEFNMQTQIQLISDADQCGLISCDFNFQRTQKGLLWFKCKLEKRLVLKGKAAMQFTTNLSSYSQNSNHHTKGSHILINFKLALNWNRFRLKESQKEPEEKLGAILVLKKPFCWLNSLANTNSTNQMKFWSHKKGRTWPSESRRMFSGFRSRWMIPFLCRCATAHMISAQYMRARSSLHPSNFLVRFPNLAQHTTKWIIVQFKSFLVIRIGRITYSN